MLSRVLRAERMKLRRSPVWLAFVLMPLFPAFFGTVNYLNNLELLKDSWYSLWTQHSLFSSYFFLPALTGVYCSYLWRLEHSGHNWNQVMTAPVPIAATYTGKFASAALMTVLAQLWSAVLFLASGLLCGLPAAAIPHELPVWIIGGVCGGMVVGTVQLYLSLVIRSFAVPVGIAMVGGIAGLMALAKGFALFFPYSLLCLGMKANNPFRELSYPQFFLSCAVFTLLFTALSILHLKNRDVKVG